MSIPISLIIGILISLTLWPFFLIITLLNELTRLLLSLIFTLTRSSYRLIARGSDDFFHSTKGFHTNTVLLLLTSEEELTHDLSAEQDLWSKRVLSKPEYSRLKTTISTKFGYGCWQNEKNSFNIGNHVKYYDYTKPSNKGYFTEEQILTEILPLLSQPIAHTLHPQWEWLILPSVQQNDGTRKCQRILRYHHTYMDGVLLGLLLGESLLDCGDLKLTKQPVEKCVRPPFILDPKGEKLIKAGKEATLAKILGFIMLPLIIAKCLFGKKPEVGSDPLLTDESSGRRNFAISDPLNLENIKSLSASHNLSGVSFWSSIFRNAFTQVLENRSLPVTKTKDSVIRMNVTQLVPPIKSSELRNKFTVTGLELPLHGNSSWIQYSLSPDALFPYYYMAWAGRLPKWIWNSMPKAGPSSVTFTNSPFMKEGVKFGNRKVDSIVGWTIIVKPMGVGLTVVGYNNNARVTIAAEENCMSRNECREFVQLVVNEIEKLSESRITDTKV